MGSREANREMIESVCRSQGTSSFRHSHAALRNVQARVSNTANRGLSFLSFLLSISGPSMSSERVQIELKRPAVPKGRHSWQRLRRTPPQPHRTRSCWRRKTPCG